MSIKNKMHHDVRNAIDRRVNLLECRNHKSDRQIAFGLLRSQQRIKSILSNHSVEEAVSDATIAAATQESTKAFYSSFLEKTHMAIIQYKLLQEEKRIEIRHFLGQGTRVLAKSLKHFLRGKISNRIVPRSNRRGSRYRRRNSLRNRRRNRRRRRSFVERRNHYIRKRLRNPYLL